MQQSAVDEPTAPDQAPLPQECGWFASSMELRAGLEVKELSTGRRRRCRAPITEPARPEGHGG